MITLSKEYEFAADSNKAVLSGVKKYLLKEFKIDEASLLNDTEFYIRKGLEKVKTLNNRIVEVRLERKRLRDDLTDLERAYCKGDSCDVNESGYNNGGKPNQELNRQIEKIQLQEKLGSLVLKSRMLEHSLIKQNELMRKFINTIPQEQYIQVMTLTYIECLPTGKIADVLSYTYDYTKHARCRAIKALAEILKLTMSPTLL